MQLRIGLVVAGIMVMGATAGGHHSISGAYDTSKEIRLEGVVSRLEFVNPHPFVTLTVESDGKSQEWKLELDNRSELIRIGMTSETLRPRDRVIVRGSPGRTQPFTLYVNRLDRPEDGLRYEQIGTTPHLNFSRR